MIAASFLTKDLLTDWRWGQAWFHEHLVDADLASNNGGWQWCASTGTDPQPYFRIFNPTLQGRRFDPDGSYARRWIPELHNVKGRGVYEPAALRERAPSYPRQCVDHGIQREIALAEYRRAKLVRL